MEVKLIKDPLVNSLTLNKWYRVISANITGIETFESFTIFNDHSQVIEVNSKYFSWTSSKGVKPSVSKSIEDRLKIVGDSHNNGGVTDYYKLRDSWKEVQDIIEDKSMPWNVANIFKACFRFGGEHHSSEVRDLNKIIFFAERQKQLILKNKNND